MNVIVEDGFTDKEHYSPQPWNYVSIECGGMGIAVCGKCWEYTEGVIQGRLINLSDKNGTTLCLAAPEPEDGHGCFGIETTTFYSGESRRQLIEAVDAMCEAKCPVGMFVDMIDELEGKGDKFCALFDQFKAAYASENGAV